MITKAFKIFWELPYKTYLLFICTICAACLATALAAEVVFKIYPCILCVYERYVFAALATASLIGVARPSRLWVMISLLIMLAGAVLTGYHVGVEQHWWEGFARCTTPPIAASSMDEMREMMRSTPFVRCDAVGWRIFGVSATIWTALLFAGMSFMTGLKLCVTPKND